MIRVVLIDDHDVVRAGLAKLLHAGDGCSVVGESAAGREALALARRHQPDVMVLDVALKDRDGVAVCRELHEALPRLPVLVLTMFDDVATVQRAVDAGARGYVLKGDGAAILQRALARLSDGETYFSAAIEAHAHAALLPRSASQLISDREIEVLRLVADGQTSKQIAATLALSPKTVENYRAHLMDKLGIRTTAGLVRYALRAGLVRG